MKVKINLTKLSLLLLGMLQLDAVPAFSHWRNPSPEYRWINKEISGRITDENGNPLNNVTIREKGGTAATTTDNNGQFRITLSDAGTSLIISHVGYESVEIDIRNRQQVNLKLKLADSGKMEEVVVVGYGSGTIKKLTTSVSTIKEAQIKDMPIASAADAFTGNVSGVLVENSSGAPGALPVIRVRGYGSVNAGSEPLYIVDGMIVTGNEFRLVNPKTIENITVLKDAAAGAIYGSRAGNGVIIVTTKKGRGRAKFSYNSNVGLQHVERKIDVLSGPEFVEFSRRAYEASGQQASFPANIANTNWQNEIFRNGVFQNQQVSASGSTETVQYNISMNYMGNQGSVIETYENIFSSNGNFNIKLSKKLDVGFNYTASYHKQRAADKLSGPAHGGGGVLEDAVVFYPTIPVYTENGDYGEVRNQNWGSPLGYAGYGNPVAALKEVHDLRSGLNGIGKLFLKYQPINGLTINGSFNGLVYSNFRDYHESPYMAANGHSDNANFSNPRFDNVTASQTNGLRTSYMADAFVDYKKTFGSIHNLTVVAGYSQQYIGYRGTEAWSSVNDRGSNATNPLPRFSNYLRPNIFGANDIRGGGGFSEETFESVFGRINYDYNDKYLFMVSLRRDGSSKFAPGNRYGVFPAISAAWRVTGESFAKDINWLDELKIRTSYGISGNDQIGPYSWQGKLSYGGTYVYGPAGQTTGAAIIANPSSLENPKLKWETNEQYNLGIDLSIIKNRIGLTADYFVKNTRDLLLSRPLPAENGVSGSIMDNIGNLRNTGIELALTTVNIKKKDFEWTSNWIFNRIWNKATKIFAPDGIIRMGSGEYNSIWIIEGEEMFQFYGYKMLGVFKTEEELEAHARPRNSQIGDPITQDLNKDGEIDANDLQRLGSALPKFTYGFSQTLRYKNFDLNILVDGSYGASKYVPALRNMSWISPIEGNITKYLYDRAGTVYGAPNLNYTGNRLWQNSYHLFDASYLRIKNITLGYSLPSNLCDKISINGLRFYVSGQNLHTFTKYPWFNPQSNYFNGSGGSAQFGVDYGGYPLSTVYTLGLNLTF